MEFGGPEDNVKGKGSTLARSPGANDANLPCKSRHISRHRAAEERSCEPATPPLLVLYVSPPPLQPLVHSSLPLPRTILRICRRWMKSFPSCYPGELSHRTLTTSRKFRDVNAIRAARATYRRPDFAYLHSRVSPEFIGHRFTNCCENPSVVKKFSSRTRASERLVISDYTSH